MEAATAALIGAAIGGCVSLATAGLNLLGTRNSLRQGAAKDIAKISIEHQIQQLNELYGPLMQLTEQNSALARRLRAGKPEGDDWRLLDHLPAVIQDPQDGPIAKEILAIDAKIEDLIINKGGLVQGAVPPESFQRFLSHFRLLKLAMEANPVDPGNTEYYPREFDEDVTKAYREIKAGIDRVLASYEAALAKYIE